MLKLNWVTTSRSKGKLILTVIANEIDPNLSPGLMSLCFLEKRIIRHLHDKKASIDKI